MSQSSVVLAEAPLEGRGKTEGVPRNSGTRGKETVQIEHLGNSGAQR